MAEILIVEDEIGLTEFLRMELELEGHRVEACETGGAALAAAKSCSFDFILLDIMLPDMDGFEVCAALRQTDVSTPIIMLTARGETADRVSGLDAGADDYLVKPFAIEELAARMRAIVRRQSDMRGGLSSDAVLTCGDIRVHLDKHRAYLGPQAVDLTLREFELLAFMMRHPNRIFSRSELLVEVWGYESPVDTNVVDVYVGYLRQKLDPQKRYVRTVRGLGYTFSEGEAE